MALPSTPNVTVSIFRGFVAASPYKPTGTQQPITNIQGVLKTHIELGRFGFNAANLHWTHLLLLDDSVDIRSAYPSQLGVIDPTKADTVYVSDYPLKGRC